MTQTVEEQQQVVSDLIFKLWHEVIRTVSKLLEADKKFGFISIQDAIDPTIPEIVFGLQVIDSILGTLTSSDLLEHDQMRQALNSRQCILHIRRLAEALDAEDQGEYEAVMDLLNKQANVA